MKKLLSSIFIVPLISLLTLYSCEEEISLPNNNSFNVKTFWLHKENETNFTFGTTNSDEPLTISQANNNLKNELKLSIRSNYADDGTGSIYFLTNDANNLYLPQDIRITPDNLSYYYEGKSGNIELKNFIRDLKQRIKEKRDKEKEKFRNEKSRIEWNKLKSDEVIKKFNEKGYSVKDLGNSLYEVSRAFQPIEGMNNMTVKMIFNTKTGIPERTTLYRNGEKIYENIIESNGGKNISYQKTYLQIDKKNLRKEKNFNVKREF